MLKEAGSVEERNKVSRQFKANLEGLFRSIYEVKSKQDSSTSQELKEHEKHIAEMKQLILDPLDLIDKTKITGCMK